MLSMIYCGEEMRFAVLVFDVKSVMVYRNILLIAQIAFVSFGRVRFNVYHV